MAVDSSYKDAPTRAVSAGGVDLVYRDLGPKAGVPVIFLVQPLAVVVVGASRIHMGAHWMTDVLGGLCLFSAFLDVSRSFAGRMRDDRGTVLERVCRVPSSRGTSS